jgi:hypothetical protein
MRWHGTLVGSLEPLSSSATGDQPLADKPGHQGRTKSSPHFFAQLTRPSPLTNGRNGGFREASGRGQAAVPVLKGAAGRAEAARKRGKDPFGHRCQTVFSVPTVPKVEALRRRWFGVPPGDSEGIESTILPRNLASPGPRSGVRRPERSNVRPSITADRESSGSVGSPGQLASWPGYFWATRFPRVCAVNIRLTRGWSLELIAPLKVTLLGLRSLKLDYAS